RGQLRPSLAVGFNPAPEIGKLIDDVLLDNSHRKQGDQSYHRAQPQRDFLFRWHAEHVIKELVLVIPEPDRLLSHIRHGASNMKEMVQELDGHVFIYRIASTELDRDAQHVEAKHRHPGCAIGLLDKAAGRQRPGAVEHTDIVEAEEAAFEYV